MVVGCVLRILVGGKSSSVTESLGSGVGLRHGIGGWDVAWGDGVKCFAVGNVPSGAWRSLRPSLVIEVGRGSSL